MEPPPGCVVTSLEEVSVPLVTSQRIDFLDCVVLAHFQKSGAIERSSLMDGDTSLLENITKVSSE